MTAAEQNKRGTIDQRGLENALGSPLRLRLIVELLDGGDRPLTRDKAVQQTGSHGQDIVACLRPMIAWGIVETLDDGQAFRLDPRMGAEHRATLERIVAARGEFVERERAVRGQVLCGMIGVDPKMLMVFEMIHQVARLDIPVHVTGETGTGKELVARAIHELSNSRTHEFGALNCGTVSDELFSSEMFGHARGSFTGAHKDHVGLIERCDKGTLFLDEVGELSLANQVKLLRVLQERTFIRVGDEKVRSSEFRIVCATHRDLARMAAEGSFREDLYYRLNVFPLRLPSLRERQDDIPFLVDELLSSKLRRYHPDGRQLQLTPAAHTRLRSHHWPGNVRELENVLMRSLVMAGDGPIDVFHLPDLGPVQKIAVSDPDESAILLTLAEVEARHIRRVLRAREGNISSAASVLGISRTTLYKKIRDHALEPDGSG